MLNISEQIFREYQKTVNWETLQLTAPKVFKIENM